ncbi:hypothetical protein HHL28_06875 [Aerophototrophica crusticola]|uniref:Uncharacterized protein n=1 Tax=Aerophototrophica crusticola TaxID=1709002 RepID=A0A858R5Z5_9PROT|nr:hypothetical protein HHL28_06875 [Rhodospirillaceae bacterium B3]
MAIAAATAGRSRPNTLPSVADRVALALSRGTLMQWLQVEDGAQAAEAKALLSAAKAKHIQVLTDAQVAERHAKALAEVTARAFATTPAPVAPVIEVEEAPKPAALKSRRKAVAAPKPTARRAPAHHPIPIAAE